MQSNRVTGDLHYLRTAIVNVFFIGKPGRREWVLVDAGVGGYASRISEAAAELFGEQPPAAIILTHGHFDHVGSLKELLGRWDVPVYAHPFEFPFLTGKSAYPPPDPLVGRGSMSLVSRLYPREPIDISGRLQPLPSDQTLPQLDGWLWLLTPGHSPGHVSLFRPADRFVVAGDAVTTVKQESALAVARQRRELHGPPAYFTLDWDLARASVQALAELEPELLATGHGIPLRGAGMREALHQLAVDFDRTERPSRGRYVRTPAVMGPHGPVSIPPDPLPRVMGTAVTAGALAAVGAGLYLRRRKL